MSASDLIEPSQSSGALAGEKPRTYRKAASKSGRTRAREFAVQALYQHVLNGGNTAAIDAFTRDLTGFHKCDSAHFDALLYGCVAQAAELDALMQPHLDRPLAEIAPVERVVLWLGLYELKHCLETPWRVVMNEAIELAKSFGGTDGHKFVNGILNQAAPLLRTAEVARDRAKKSGQ